MKKLIIVSALALMIFGCSTSSAKLEAYGGDGTDVNGVGFSMSATDFGSQNYVWENFVFPKNKTDK